MRSPSLCHSCDRPCPAAFDEAAPWRSDESDAIRTPRFFLHESGGFNNSEVIAAFTELLRGSHAPDHVMPASDAQYLVDLPIIKALRASPHRTFDADEAVFNVIAAMPFASHVLGKLEDATSSLGGRARHLRRMHRLSKALAAEPCFMSTDRAADSSCGTLAPYLLITSGVVLDEVLGGPLQKVLAAARPDAIWLASVDPGLAAIGRNTLQPARFLLGAALTLPYWAHTCAGTQLDAAVPRRGVLFHGGVQRFDFGVRPRIVAMLQTLSHRHDNASFPVDLRIAEMTARGASSQLEQWTAYVQSGRAFAASSLCMAPAGDTLTSRRTFDALAGGCVPVHVRSGFLYSLENYHFGTALPFPSSIDWQRLTLRLIASTPAECAVHGADWLAAWHDQRAALTEMRRAGVAAFRAHLDLSHNPHGVAVALLREAAVRKAMGPQVRPACGFALMPNQRGGKRAAWRCRKHRKGFTFQ